MALYVSESLRVNQLLYSPFFLDRTSMAVVFVLTTPWLTAHMRRLLVNTWDIVAPLGIHVIIATLTTLLVGIVTIVVATVTGTATIMEETEIGAIVEAPLREAVDTPLTIGVAGATPAAHPLEEAALHLVVEGVAVVVVVAQETTTHPPEEALLQLQHLLLNIHGGEDLTPSALADSSHCRASAWIGSSPLSCGMWYLCLSRSIYCFLVLFFLLGPWLSFLILSDCFFICPVAEVAVVVVMGLQDVQSQNMFWRKKFLYSNYNEEQWGLKKRLAHNFPEKKKKNISSSTTSPIQVVKFCSSASSLVICLQVPRYICYLTKTARKKQKERKCPLSGWRFSAAVGMAVLVWEGLIGD
jgi:hypothetical protein